jgi:hypothetical protein
VRRARAFRRFAGVVILAAVVAALWWPREATRERPERVPSAGGGPAAGAPPAPASPPASTVEAVPTAAGPPASPAHGADAGASELARAFWRADDYLAYVDRHLDAALAGDAEAAYFVAMAQQACISAVGRPTLSGNTAAIEDWLARRPGLSDEQADAYRRRLHRCTGFVDAYTTEEEAEVLEEAAGGLLRAAAAAGHPAAVVELRMWAAEGWRDGAGRDAVLDELADAAASGHPEALRKLGEYLGGDAGAVLTLLACRSGYDCAPDADWVVEFCQFGWAVCGIEADGPEALLGSLPGYRAREVEEQAAALRGGTAASFRPFLATALEAAAVPPR